jgi:tripartite-type tricarboxylate transporter receptor subunit TctC
MKLIPRRGIAAATLTTMLLAAPLAARAADSPFTCDNRFLRPSSEGGTSDLLGRTPMEQIGQHAAVENGTGIGGVVATQDLVRSAPDGHTILLASMGGIAEAVRIAALTPGIDLQLALHLWSARGLSPVAGT